MIDWEGNMSENKDRRQIILSNIPQYFSLAASVEISCVKRRVVDTVFERSTETPEEK